MTIRELRILPPLAIGRLGSAPEPLDNYTVDDDPDHPLDFRTIKPAPTFIVDPATGEITGTRTPESIAFKQDGRIRPVAPFLEVFAVTGDDKLVPLTLGLLRKAGLGPNAIKWNVVVANRKVTRRTNHKGDHVEAKTGWFSNHDPHPLKGYSAHFISKAAFIDFGHVRYIKPSENYPEIRLRFTPAKGLIYGPQVDKRHPTRTDPNDPKLKLFKVPEAQAIYDPRKGWYNFEVPVGIDSSDPNYKGKFFNETSPSSLFAIVPPAPCWLHGNVAVSRGYLDDACDGIVTVQLELKGGRTLEAAARIVASPPAVVPDSQFLRTLADDLEQVIYGPGVPRDETQAETRARALDIIRRAFETVRFLNVAVMNGNPVKGRDPLIFDTMPAEEAFDVQRLMRPVVPERTADTLQIMALHQQVFAALRGGAAPWFANVLRRPEEVADFTDHGRRKMPAMMCGADGSYLALTHRQINAIRKAAGFPTGAPAPAGAIDPAKKKLTPRNLSAQINHAAAGNPFSTLPKTSVGNCTPGLEVDFRAVWRRLFEGIVLREWDNLVVEVDPDAKGRKRRTLAGHRLLRVNGVNMMTTAIGPSPADPHNQTTVLATDDNPTGTVPLEWSNALAFVLHKFQNKTVTCDFTSKAVWLDQAAWTGEKGSYITMTMKVRQFFEGDTAVISRELAKPGELTQGLCSPWQNDYRECSCYYWASARPDFVNVEPSTAGTSQGDNWLQKERTGDYVADDYVDSRLILYDELFSDWETYLRFQVRGRDAETSAPLPKP